MYYGEEDGKFKKILSQAENLEARFKVGGSKAEAFTDFGLCKDCGNFSAFVTKFNRRTAFCQEFSEHWVKVKLDPNDPVDFCTKYYKRGQLDIHAMKDMATMVEIKNPLGFNPDEDE